MTDWKLAMLLILPLMLHWRLDWRMLATRRVRTWATMFGASIAALIVPALPASGPIPLYIIGAYMAIDLLSGVVVLALKPVGCAQRAIGWLFAFMILFHIGFGIMSNGGNTGAYISALSTFGWVQWACLFSWGAYDVGKAALGWLGFDRPAVPYRKAAR
ncbi:MAG: hypothetical protein ACRCYS_06775 [Beijerinckiaceae bacterium]